MISAIVARWNRFFFEPLSPLPIGVFRILYGAAVIATLLLLRQDWLAWYGTRAWVTLATQQRIEPGPRLNLFVFLPQNSPSTDVWIQALFWVFLASAVLLTAGYLTRLNTILVYVLLSSIHQRNLIMTHGGDTFLRVTGFFLMFAPAGAALSIDRLLRVRSGKESSELIPRSPWAQRMIQLQLSILYFAAFCWKIQGAPWLEGTALSYVYHVDELRRFPVPAWLLSPFLLQLGNWFALALEFSLGVLIWVKPLRYPLLLIGLLFHLAIEYSLNVPMFEWDVLTAYILFVEPADIAGAWESVRRTPEALRRRFAAPANA